jgi:hypothetical protein
MNDERPGRGGMVFKGSPESWGGSTTGSTGNDHVWRKRNDRLVRLAEDLHETRQKITLEELEKTFGVPVGLDDANENPLESIDSFVAHEGLDTAGVDTVFARFNNQKK